MSDLLTAAPDLLLIDGHSGRGNVRYGTLPLILPTCAGRVGSSSTMRYEATSYASPSMAQRRGVEVDGIHLVGHGLLEGRLD